MTQHLTGQEFIEQIFDYKNNTEWKYKGTLPCVIDFWAPWCGPCRTLGPVIDELSEEYAGKVAFYKVNTDEEQELSDVFGIRSIPTILFVPVQGIPKAAAGALPKEALKEIIGKELQATDAETQE